jgi:hypothetical protein
MLPIKRFLVKPAISFVLILLAYIFTIHFVSQEKCIYSWDYGERYNDFIILNNWLKNNSADYIKNQIFQSIEECDYNYLSALILSPFSFISTSRAWYLIAVLTIYYIPGYILFLRLVKVFNGSINYIQHTAISILYLFSTSLLTPILLGQSSIDGLILINLIFLILFKRIKQNSNYFSDKIRFLFLLVISICFALLPILHRWYLFFSLIFIIIFLFQNIYFFYKKKKRRLKNFINLIANQVILVILTSAIFILISRNLWQRFFLVDYFKIYSSFKIYNNIFLSVNHLFLKIGYVIIFLFILSVYFQIIKKNVSLVVFFCVQFLFTMLCFLKIQNFAVQHYYLIIIPILFIISLNVALTKNYWFSYLVILVTIINFLNVYVIPLPVASKTIILSQLLVRPQIDENMETVKFMMDDFLKYYQNQSSGKFYIASSSFEINNSMLLNEACYYEAKYLPLCSKIADPSLILKRDKFPKDFPKSDYVLLLNPQTYNDPAITNIKDFVMTNKDYYRYIKNYALKDGTKVELYHKILPVPDNLYQELEVKFNDDLTTL